MFLCGSYTIKGRFGPRQVLWSQSALACWAQGHVLLGSLGTPSPGAGDRVTSISCWASLLAPLLTGFETYLASLPKDPLLKHLLLHFLPGPIRFHSLIYF